MWWGAMLVVTTACGRYGFIDRTGGGGIDGALSTDGIGDGPQDGMTADASSADAPHDCPWGAATAVANVNSGLEDWEPTVRPDGLTLVFNRQMPTGPPHLFMSHRASPATTFSVPVQVLASAKTEEGPVWSPDGTVLYFVSDRGPSGGANLYTAAFDSGSVSFGPAAVVPELSTTEVIGPAISPSGLELYYCDASMTPSIRYANRLLTTDPWIVRGVIAELTSGAGDGWPAFSPDGLTLYFESNRDSALGLIYSAKRTAVGAAWTSIAQVTELEGGLNDGDPDLSPDGLTIYFASDRNGGLGQNDIYTATRACF